MIEYLLTTLVPSPVGLEINTTKTEVLWLGQWKNNQDTPFGFKWPKEPVLALGAFFSYQADAEKLNFGNKIRKLEKTLNAWKRRKLTLYGKINIVKTLNQYIEQINNIICNFIWMVNLRKKKNNGKEKKEV